MAQQLMAHLMMAQLLLAHLLMAQLLLAHLSVAHLLSSHPPPVVVELLLLLLFGHCVHVVDSMMVGAAVVVGQSLEHQSWGSAPELAG